MDQGGHKKTRDHFVPKTYLKRWCDSAAKGRVHVFRKRNGRHSPELPANVCLEARGDINKYFNNPLILREYLTDLENHWGTCLETIIAGELDPDAYMVAAGMASYLLSCGPTGRRLATSNMEITLNNLHPMLVKQALRDGDGEPDEAMKAILRLVKEGKIKAVVDPDYPKAIHISNLYRIQAQLFAGKWHLIDTDGYRHFITSDFPVCRRFSGPTDLVGLMHFPICPTHTLLIKPDTNRPPEALDLNDIPFGGRMMSRFRPEGVDLFNDLVAQCAEDVIVGQLDEPWIGDLLHRYRTWGMDVFASTLPTGAGGFCQITQYRPHDRHLDGRLLF